MLRSIRIFSPRGAFVEDITPRVTSVVATHRWHGGDVLMTLRVTGAPRYLQAMQKNWLGLHIEESHDSVSWSGMVVAMDRKSGFTRTRTALFGRESDTGGDTAVFNAVRVVYTGGVTAWVEDVVSIARFGRIERQYKLDTANATIAYDYATRQLRRRASPRIVAIGIEDDSAEFLDLTAWGYHTAAAKTVATTTYTGSVPIHTVFMDAVAECPDLKIGIVDTTSSVLIDSADIKAGTPASRIDLAIHHAPQGWRAYVDHNRRYHFGPASPPETFTITREGVKRTWADPTLESWRVRPGWFRDETATPPHTLFVSEVVRRDGRRPELRAISEADRNII